MDEGDFLNAQLIAITNGWDEAEKQSKISQTSKEKGKTFRSKYRCKII